MNPLKPSNEPAAVAGGFANSRRTCACRLASPFVALRNSLLDIGLGMRAQPGRTALAFLSITLGSLALAVLVAVLGGLKAKAERMLREFGGQVIVLTPAETSVAGAPALTEHTAAVLAENFPDALVSAVRRYEAPAQGSGATVAIMATDARLAIIRDWTLVGGRFLDDRDMRHRERSAVLSSPLAQAWGARIGNLVTLGGMPFRVVGIVECGGTALAGATENPLVLTGERVVFVPLSVAPVWVGQALSPGSELDAIFLRLPEGVRFEAGRERAERVLGDPALMRTAVAWITPDTILRGVRRLQRAFDVGIGSITFLSLVLGGITLMSLLVGNVRERVAEIGLRRALGATRGDVAALFVMEGILLTILAALTGSAVARWVVQLLSTVPEIALAVDSRIWTIPLAMALVVGLIAAYFPARMAARITPADSLRAE